MTDHPYAYVAVGAGPAASAAVEGIRERDATGSILLIGAEDDPPYDRPPLSKQLWSGAKKADDIYLHDRAFYDRHGVELRLGTRVVALDPAARTLRDAGGETYRYQKLLLATGGTPRRLTIPGGDLGGLCYFRTVDDYRRLRSAATAGRSALIIGGGFIGSEIAAALRTAGLAVTMIFPGQWLVSRVFPEALGRALTDRYRDKGVEVLTGDTPLSIERDGERYRTRTQSGSVIHSDLIVVGIGITPNIDLARVGGLETGNGVIVSPFLRTSDPDIYAAGDIARFPEAVLGPRRIEHWDNAVSQGKHAGRNMAGAAEPFTSIPFFFSDLFEFGYEAVGDTDSRHETLADWQEENTTGVVYYLSAGRVRGAMMCNLFGKVDAARELIRREGTIAARELRGAIR
ncbi:MAG: NAD(P)/FAD-dependent oxidoreductase [Phycisphaerales bacterium]|nr:NAD(P)/FAD-dependent oxidoreductase [Phycisphaerales bacterium]